MNAMNDVLRECRNLRDHGASVEEVIRALRERGLSKVHSMKALVDLGITDLGDAKHVVHESSTWADVRERDEEFQRKLG
jgi:hypothetical protein